MAKMGVTDVSQCPFRCVEPCCTLLNNISNNKLINLYPVEEYIYDEKQRNQTKRSSRHNSNMPLICYVVAFRGDNLSLSKGILQISLLKRKMTLKRYVLSNRKSVGISVKHFSYSVESVFPHALTKSQ